VAHTFSYGAGLLRDDTATGSTTYTPGVSQRSGVTDLFFHEDWQGSTRYLTDATGLNAPTGYRHDAYGMQIASSGPDATALKWCGQHEYQADMPLGLSHVGARQYDSFTGRFLNRDPIGFAGGLNLYAYCNGDPVNLVDPSGLDAVDDLSNFFAGAGDSLTFGGTDLFRSWIGQNEAVDHTSGWYRAGEASEIAVEIAVTGGAAGARHLAARAIARHGCAKAANLAARKEGEQFIVRSGRRALQQKLGPKAVVHHRNTLFGHPWIRGFKGAAPALAPTGGLPARLHSGWSNTKVLRDLAAHQAAHRRAFAQERWAKRLINRYTIGAKATRDVGADIYYRR
jgi:RHS repeat-associated protein